MPMVGSTLEQRKSPQVFKEWEQRIRQITSCRICGNARLTPVVDLGSQCLASLFDDGRPENQMKTPVPLKVVRCDPDENAQACRFVQLTHTVPPDVLYNDYGYRSSINTTMRHHLQGLTRDVESRIPLRQGDIVVDIGANDGVTLLAYQASGLVRVGFEPSNIRPQQPDHGLVYIPACFNAADFRLRFPQQKARVITSIAMFYDLDDPGQCCRDLHEVLSDDGLWVVEMSYLGAMLDHDSFDAICHEHLGYYSLRTLQHITREAGFAFHDIAFNDANGGSIRCYLKKDRPTLQVPAESQQRIDQALRAEDAKGYHDPKTFGLFDQGVRGIKKALTETLETVRAAGKRIYGYGASTKGNVLLQYAGIGPQHLVAIADRNPAKVGRCTLGTGIRICSEEEMRQARPEYLLILPWHFLDEFMERERALRASGTKLIVPFPRVRIV